MRELLGSSPKSDYGMEELLASPPKSDYGMEELLASPLKSDYGMWELLTPSPPLDFGMRELLTLSPKSDFGMGELLTSFPGPTSGVGMREMPSPSLSSELTHEFGTQETHSPSPVPIHHSNLRIQEPLSPELQDDAGTQTPPPPEPQGSSSTSMPGREFHMARSYMHLPLIIAGYEWGKKAPPPITIEKKGQPSTVGEAECREQSVCQAIHMLVSWLIHTCSRMIPRAMGRSYASEQVRFERYMALFRKYIIWRKV